MKIVLSLLFIILSSTATAEEIRLSDTGISFISPVGFKSISPEIIDIKWPQKNAPKWVVGNESASTTIAYDLKPNDISAIPLPDLMDYFKKTFDRIVPGIDWKKREIIEISGRSWVYLEMTTHAIDADIYSIMLLTSYGKEMLIFNFNSTRADFPQYEEQLRHSIKSIQLPN